VISELQQVKFPVIVVVYVATSLANKGEYIGCLHGAIVGATDRSCKHSIRPRNCSEQGRDAGKRSAQKQDPNAGNSRITVKVSRTLVPKKKKKKKNVAAEHL